MASLLEKQTRLPVSDVFRRAYIKRRQTSDGKYESSWQEITEFIEDWGTFRTSIDYVRLNRFTHTGINLTVSNDDGSFNPESNANSLWYNYLTRYRTLVKIEAGYYLKDAVTSYWDAGEWDTDYFSEENELPTTPTLGIFIIDDEIPISARRNSATLQCKNIVSVFDEVRARDIVGLGATQTASELMAKIRDHTDGSGAVVFRQFISAASWSIQTTTNYYNFATSTALENMTAWDMMTKLAEAEGFVVYVNRLGQLVFTDRTANTTASQFSFYGLNFRRPNIIALEDYREALTKHYNYFRLKYLSADTSTSYLTAGTVTSISPSNQAWKYGSRVYDFENTFIANTTTAQAIADALYSNFYPVKTELELACVFIPHLEMLDRVGVYYRSYDLIGAALYDMGEFDTDVWADESGENFDWSGQEFKVTSIETDLEHMKTTLALREA